MQPRERKRKETNKIGDDAIDALRACERECALFEDLVLISLGDVFDCHNNARS